MKPAPIYARVSTSAQAIKILTLALQWPLLNPPSPSFLDVPTHSTFYIYIESI